LGLLVRQAATEFRDLALLAAASGANAAFFVNHSLVADEVAAAVGRAL
jgi:hypothetical protein